jgi:hypothetical protein
MCTLAARPTGRSSLLSQVADALGEKYTEKLDI